MELYITLGIITVGIFLFVKEFFSIDTTSLLIMAMFIVSGVLSPEEGFSGFIHPATLTLGCMFVISAAIFKSGIIDGLSNKIIKLAKIHYIVALMVFTFVTGLFSAFVNDTAVVAIMIPMALLVCKETGISPSKLLIPISFAACFGGACTLIGTGTNILISSYAQKSGLPEFDMFELTPIALVLAAIGFFYMFIIAPFLLPKRNKNNDTTLIKQAEKYMAEIILIDSCPDINKKLIETKLVIDYKIQLLTVIRGTTRIRECSPDFILEKNDILNVVISPENLISLKDTKGYSIQGDKLEENEAKEIDISPTESTKDIPNNIRKIYEVLIPIGSKLASKSLKELHFRDVYRSSVLAIRQRNEMIMQNLSELKLKEGDMLLVYSTEKDIARLTAQHSVFMLSNYEKQQVNYKKAIPALLIAIGVIGAAALNITSILMSAMIGCLLIITSSILKPQEAYEAINWKVIFMIAGVLSMGNALESSGGSTLISGYIFDIMGDLDKRITLSLVFLITFLSTNIISGKATAGLMTPIVISLAAALQVSERPLLIAVMLACALTFMTPIANPTNTMVYSPGNYKFNDYLKIGTPLNIIIWIAATFLIPLFFPF
ncbi:MAG: SLC13 family permease [Vicingaceae bacterium]|jgi:di/tricarboxylate transporter|nr:SLC13 family permease [Flavobacteriales bacterium]MDF1676324.1 SLC13 family permease [Vicingaceae bacterium]|tara:strand:- start:28819 stop:30630 length:1812 start_codon:yes stop_codon:yes gene_type:complete